MVAAAMVFYGVADQKERKMSKHLAVDDAVCEEWYLGEIAWCRCMKSKDFAYVGICYPFCASHTTYNRSIFKTTGRELNVLLLY